MTQDETGLPELFSTPQWRDLAEHFELTPRQEQVARMLCRGLNNKEIGSTLDITRDAVNMHVRKLLQKLRVSHRVGVVVRLVVTEREL